MLTGSLLLTRIRGLEVVPLFLDPSDPRLLGHAALLIDHFRERALQLPAPRRREVRESLAPLLLGPGNPKVWEGMAHILEKRCAFQEGETALHESFRIAIFENAALARNQGSFDRSSILQKVTLDWGPSPMGAEDLLFGDLPLEQPLVSFEGLTPQALVHWYNIGLVQGILLQSSGIRAEMAHPGPAGIRSLARRANFHKLLCQFGRSPEGHLRLAVDGPLSLFGPSHRYGFHLACFFPCLLDHGEWRFKAKLFWGKKNLAKTLSLDAEIGLRWPESRPSPNTQEMEDLLARFRDLPESEWDLQPCEEPLHVGASYWVPDLVCRRKTKSESVFVEIPGAWRAKNLESLRSRLARKKTAPALFCLKESHCLGEMGSFADDPGIYLFKKTPILSEILKRCELLLEAQR